MHELDELLVRWIEESSEQGGATFVDLQGDERSEALLEETEARWRAGLPLRPAEGAGD